MSAKVTSPPLHAHDMEGKRLHALLAHTRETVALFDRNMKLLSISSAVEQLLGYAPAEYGQLGTYVALLHPDDRKPSKHLITALLQTPGESATTQHHVKHQDGTYRWVEATLTNLLDDPEIGAVLAHLRDITELKRLEAALQASENRYRTLSEERRQLLQREQQARQEAELERRRLPSLFAQAPALIHILRGPDHVFEFFHPFGKDMVGGRDLTGMKVREALPEYEGQGYFELLDHVYQTGEPYRITEMPSFLKAADGSLIERFFNAIFQPWYDVDGQIAGILNFAVEVTDQVRARQQVEHQRDELLLLNAALEQAHRGKQFFSTMSHELRTPLASIIGFTQMLLDDAQEANLTQQQQHDLERILKNGQHLLSLINDVLDLSKIEAGRMVVNYSQVDVRELLTSVVEEIQSMALAQHLVLRAEVEEGIDSLESNPLKLRQILLNLVSNAIKFTEQGEVTVSATRVISPEQEGERVALAVKDSGMGIPVDMQEHIFEAFYQADGTYTRKAGGTGLGLSIVSQLTTLLGGTIAVESAPGEGSTFTVLLPLKAVHHSLDQGSPRLHLGHARQAPKILPSSGNLAPALSDASLAGSANRGASDGQNNLILAVDDNPDIIVLIKAALKGTAYTVVGVQDPLQTMELVQALRPCAIMLDVLMPDVNGWQLLHQLKENPATASIPVMMVTVLTEPTTGYVLGADAYLIKPFKTTVLLDTLGHLLASQKSPPQAGEREAKLV